MSGSYTSILYIPFTISWITEELRCDSGSAKEPDDSREGAKSGKLLWLLWMTPLGQTRPTGDVLCRSACPQIADAAGSIAAGRPPAAFQFLDHDRVMPTSGGSAH